MIKKILIILWAIIFTHNVFGQKEEPKITWAADLGVSYSIIDISQRVELQVGALATYKRHQFRIAPLIHLWSSEASSNERQISMSGFVLDYFLHIPSQHKTFELFFKYEMAFQFYQNEWIGTYYDAKIPGYQYYSDKSNEFFYTNSVAYGFTYHPAEKVFLRIDTGIGFYYSSIKGDHEEFYGLTGEQYDFRGYKDAGIFIKMGFSAGYNF
jgi:hypothetical protein